MGPKEIHNGIYIVGSSDITDPKDCCVYLLDLGELVLIDAGAGTSVSSIAGNIEKLGFDVSKVSTIILTHCHIDHVGGAGELKKLSGAKIVMHELDAGPVERGDGRMTAASWYGVNFLPLPVDIKFSGGKEVLAFGDEDVVLLHTPGHTPGSISVYVDKDGKRVLFGQDIHGPFLADFGANMAHWQSSMELLISLKADILCEGHFGIYEPGEKVTDYIERYLDEYGE